MWESNSHYVWFWKCPKFCEPCISVSVADKHRQGVFIYQCKPNTLSLITSHHHHWHHISDVILYKVEHYETFSTRESIQISTKYDNLRLVQYYLCASDLYCSSLYQPAIRAVLNVPLLTNDPLSFVAVWNSYNDCSYHKTCSLPWLLWYLQFLLFKLDACKWVSVFDICLTMHHLYS